MSIGTRLQTRYSSFLDRHGETVTVTRRPATQGGTATTQSLVIQTKPLAREQMNTLIQEGILNAGEADPILFCFKGDADVKESLDKVSYLGATYRLVSLDASRTNGVTTAQFAVGVRE